MKLTLDTLPMYCDEVGDHCLHWRLGVNSTGYPQANLEGAVWMVRRYVVQRLMGHSLPPRTPIVARCGCRLCVSPKCLHVSTMSAVLRKAYRHGMRHTQHEYLARHAKAVARGWCKLTREQVDAMRALDPGVSHAEAGRIFGVHAKTAGNIRRGLSWRESAPSSSVFSWRPA